MEIDIDPGEAIKYGGQIQESATKFNDEVAKIYSTVETLAESWTGTAATNFTTNITSFKTEFENFGKLISEFGDLLVAIGTDYQKLEDEL